MVGVRVHRRRGVNFSLMEPGSPQPRGPCDSRPQLVFINQEPIFQWLGPALLIGAGIVTLVMGGRTLLAPDPSPAMLTVVAVFSTVFLSAGFLHARHIRRGRHRRITIDYTSRTILFENFRLFSTFFSGFRPIPEQRVPFDDLLGTTTVRNARVPDQLYIAVRGGRITVNEHFCDFHLLKSALHEIASETPPPPFHHTAAFQWILGAGIFGFTILLLYIAHLTGILGAVLDFAHNTR